MAKGAYVGVDGVAHKVKKIYTGVDNVAKQVKKGYVGVGGVARPFFSAEAGLEYYGAITPLSEARSRLAATTVGKYALFGGGAGSGSKGPVDAYDNTLTRSTPTVLSEGREFLAATTVVNYAMFGGGVGNNPQYKDTVDAYNISLTRSTPMGLSEGSYELAATTVGNYALFGGGAVDIFAQKSSVDAYVDSAWAEIPSHLSIDGGEGDYDLIDLIDGTITKISQEYSDFLTLKRGHAYMFALSAPDSSMWKKIKRIDATVFSNSGTIDYECNGAIGYSRDTIYIAPNISVPTGDPEDLPILTIVVYFDIV